MNCSINAAIKSIIIASSFSGLNLLDIKNPVKRPGFYTLHRDAMYGYNTAVFACYHVNYKKYQ